MATEKTHWETRAECDQKLFQRNISKWLQCSILSAVLILLFWIDRECPEWIHLRLVCVCVCICGNVCFQVYLHMNVCQRERCGLSYALLIVACWLRSALIAV